MNKVEIITVLVLLLSIILGTFLWKFLALNDYLKYLIFIFIPVFSFFLLRVYQKKFHFLEFINELRDNKFNIYKKNENLLTVNTILLFFVFLEFLSLNFPVFQLDFFHEGQELSSSYRSLIDNSLWSGSFIIIGIIQEVLTSKFIWKMFNHESIGLMRYMDLIYILLCKIFIILIIYKISIISRLNNFYSEFFFLICSLICLSLINYNNDRLDYDYILYRELLTLITIYLFLEIISRKKGSNFFVILIGLIGPFSFLWSLDRAVILNCILLVIFFYFLLSNNQKKIILFVSFYTISFLVLNFLLGREFNSFLANSSIIIQEMGEAYGLIHPIPFSEEKESTRATKTLLLILFSILVSLSLINKTRHPINLRVSFILLSIISFFSYSYALSRSDKIHIAESSGYPIIFTVIFFLYFCFKFFNKKNLIISNNFFSKKTNFFLAFIVIFIFFFKSISINNILNYKDRFIRYAYLKDENYLNKEAIEFVKKSKKYTEEYGCIQLFTYDAAILYLLRKISCTKYYFVWSIVTRNLQEDLIKRLKNVQIIIADKDNNKKNSSPISSQSLPLGVSARNNLILVNEYIDKKYKKIIEIEDKIILKLK